VDHTESINYKSVERFGRYISDRGRIEPRRKTGTCARHQRMLATAIKRARHVALVPFTQDHIRLTGVMAPRPPMRREPMHGPPPRPVAVVNGGGEAEVPPAVEATEEEAIGAGAAEETSNS